MAQKQSRHAWLFFLFWGVVLGVGGVWILLFHEGEDSGPRWPFSATSLGIYLVVVAPISLAAAFYYRLKR